MRFIDLCCDGLQALSAKVPHHALKHLLLIVKGKIHRYCPLKSAARFSRKALVPSRMSCVVNIEPKSDAS